VGASATPIYQLIERLYGEKLVTVRQEVAATPITGVVAAVPFAGSRPAAANLSG